MIFFCPVFTAKNCPKCEGTGVTQEEALNMCSSSSSSETCSFQSAVCAVKDVLGDDNSHWPLLAPVWVQWVLMQKLLFLDRMPPVNSWWPTIVQESALWKNAKATIARLNCLHWYVLWNSNVKISILHLVKYINSSNTVKPVLSGHRIKRTPSIKRTVAEVPKFIPLIFFKWHLY